MAANRNRPRDKRRQLENGELSRDNRETFLARLAETSNVSRSAEEAGINKSTAYRLRRKDTEFARQWLMALYEGYVHLEMEVICRLREGRIKTEDGDRYDFANAIRLLAAHRETAARAQAQQRNVSAAEVRDSIDRTVEQIRDHVRREKRQEGRKA